jgi:parvulin-like peptidyl-prolyl isomerase
MISKKILISTSLCGLLSTSLLAEPLNKVYATINGDTIKSSDIAMILKDPKINFDALPKENQKMVLDQIIDSKILASKAIKSDIVKSDTFKKNLEDRIKLIKEDLALQMWLVDMSKNITVTENDLKAFYEKNKDKFEQSEQFKANHILVQTEKEAQDIIEKLKKSKNVKDDFIKIAKEKSTGPSGKNGGDLGWFEAKMMVPEFSEATASLNKGNITQTPVKTQFGYHVIYLDDKKEPSIASYVDVKDNLPQIVSQEKFKNKVEKILEDEKKTVKIIYK